MSFTDEQSELLSAKLDLANVKKLGGNDYIEGWHAIAEANRIFGYDGWSYKVLNLESVSQHTNKNGNLVIGYICTVEVSVGGVTRQDVGFGTGISKSDIASCHEGASKEAVTDAVKRALRSFGNQFGLALYDKTKANVEDSAAIEREKVSKAKSRESFDRIIQTLRDCETPEDYNTAWNNVKQDVAAQPRDWQAEIIKERNEIKHRILDKQAAP